MIGTYYPPGDPCHASRVPYSVLSCLIFDCDWWIKLNRPMNEESLELAKLAGQAANVLVNYVIPVYQTRRGMPAQVGTGFIVRAGGEHFFVTAGHVFDLRAEGMLYFYSDVNIHRFINGSARWTSFDRSRQDDDLDVAVVKLSRQALPPYRKIKKVAMDLNVLAPRRLRERAHYLAVGFPHSKNRPNPTANHIDASAWGFYGESLPPSEYSRAGIAPDSHILLKFEEKRGFDAKLLPIRMNKPQGMSGAPIWMLASDHYSDPNEGPVVVAVATAHRKALKAVQGTDVVVVHQMIAEMLR